ncbi:hypothetical protein HA039_11075 [Streptomyces liangshanensis]|uniref:Uncharacterized protein n=2 Tax=Streptomyces liangshanensis TaxID=2717324 RepID=A0A6G9H8E2_9ACTN|nr:hypothetical protein [Streptomyces liangshanensis]QIQ06828.1 hypothetical protein HA039_11075 [Streptomyces liangshanensis]
MKTGTTVVKTDGSVVSTVKMTDRLVASVCSLDVARIELNGTGLPGASFVPSAGFAGLPVLLAAHDERPIQALEAGAAAVEAQAYAYAAASAETGRQTSKTTEHHKMWAFRGPEPWSDPA